MRVGYVLGTSAGGTERHVRMLADGLAARGVTVSVYGPAATWTAAGTAPVAGIAGPPRFAAVEIADRPRPSRDLAAVRRLRRLLASARPDVVHAHGLRAGALTALAVGGAAGRAGPGRAGAVRGGAGRRGDGREGAGRGGAGRAGAVRGGAGRGGAGRDAVRPALLVTVHNAPPGRGPAAAVYRVLERLVARRADAVLCVSADLEARMRRLGARRVTRALVPASPAPPGVSAEPPGGLRAELGLASDPAAAPVILAVARLAPQKGLDTLVEAAAGWRDRDPAPLLVIAGSGPLRADLARRAEAGRVAVCFLGRRDDVPALLAAADVVVLPSAWEGQPLIVQETLRAGRPLVASRAGGIPDLTGEDSALLVPPGDPGALSAAVLSVLDDPALAKRLGEAALQRFRSLPSEQDALDAAMVAYHRVAPGRP